MAGAGLFFASRRTMWAASDFWNKKDKAEWSAEEIHSLITKSPWAKDARVEFRLGLQPNFDGTPGGLAMPNDPNRGVPGSQDGIRMAVPLGKDGAGAAPSPRSSGGAGSIPLEATAATVRWESAQPVLEALRSSVPEDFAERYVISVTGITAMAAQRAITLEHLRLAATLQAKGKSPAQPGVIQYSRDKAILFGFSKEFLTLTVTDKNVDFLIDTGDLQIRARFEPKDMLYHGQLAV